MEIRPIKTEADYEATLGEVEKLMNAEMNTPEGDKLDVLVTLIEKYEEKHYPILPPEPVEAIIHQMESQGLSRKDLEPLIGSRQRCPRLIFKNHHMPASERQEQATMKSICKYYYATIL